jgi:hypothetical protein
MKFIIGDAMYYWLYIAAEKLQGHIIIPAMAKSGVFRISRNIRCIIKTRY